MPQKVPYADYPKASPSCSSKAAPRPVLTVPLLAAFAHTRETVYSTLFLLSARSHASLADKSQSIHSTRNQQIHANSEPRAKAGGLWGLGGGKKKKRGVLRGGSPRAEGLVCGASWEDHLSIEKSR